MPTITPPNMLQRVLRGFSYLAIGTAGVWVMVVTPSLIRFNLGIILTMVWCLFILTALPAAASAFLSWYRGEYMALPWFTGGMAVATADIWYRVTVLPDLIPRALMLTSLCLSLCVRYVALHRLVDVRKEGRRWTRSKQL